MQKLYYTDLLAAAYMAHEFGVKFLQRHNRTNDSRLMPFNVSYNSEKNEIRCFISTLLDKPDEKGNFYLLGYSSETYIMEVHPDSLHIFDEMDNKKKTALKELDMWPESEAARG